MTHTGTAPAPARSTAIAAAAAQPAEAILAATGSGPHGLTAADVVRRRERYGPNAVRTHRVSALAVLVRQLRSALLALLLVAAAVSFVLGQRTDAVVIGLILAVSVG